MTSSYRNFTPRTIKEQVRAFLGFNSELRTFVVLVKHLLLAIHAVLLVTEFALRVIRTIFCNQEDVTKTIFKTRTAETNSIFKSNLE